MLIGKGVCGKVIKEIDSEGKPRAVKIFDLKEHDTGCNEAAIFLEMRPHPQFPRVQAISLNDKGHSFIRMEYFPYTLSHFRPCFPQRYLRRFLQEMLIALALLHEKRIIHGDVKPPNILIDDILEEPKPPLNKHRIALTDFSHSVRCYPEKGDIIPMPLTTVTYRAHELAILDDEVEEYFCGTEVDLWSLGVVFYELITGRDVYRTYWTKFVDDEPDTKKVRIAGIEEMFEGIIRDQPMILWRTGPEGEGLLYALLQPNPAKRVSATWALKSMYIKCGWPQALPTFALLTRRTRNILRCLESAIGTRDSEILRLLLSYYGLQEIPPTLSNLYFARICSLPKELFLEFLPNILILLYFFKHSIFRAELLTKLSSLLSMEDPRAKKQKTFIKDILRLSAELRTKRWTKKRSRR